MPRKVSDYKFDFLRASAKECIKNGIEKDTCKKIIERIWKNISKKSRFHQANIFNTLKIFFDFLVKGHDMLSYDTLILMIEYKKPSINTRILRYYTLKTIYESVFGDFPLSKEDIPKNYKSLKKRLFSDNEIKKLIETAKKIDTPIRVADWEAIPSYVRGVILLATVYGLRRGEIFMLARSDYSPEDNTFFVKSEKGSVQRYHYVFDDIKEYFEEFIYTLNHPPDRRYLNVLFRYFSHYYANVSVKIKRNIHTFRRNISSMLLVNGVNPVFVNDFLRWKGKGTMLEFYTHLDPIFIDLEVAKKHDYLKMWKDN